MSDREWSLLEQLANDSSVLHFEDTAAPGECVYCGCTHNQACVLEVDSPDSVTGVVACGWYRRPDYRGFGVCTNPECVKAYIADRGAP